jgi:tetratricopeptide (TPR) repeat protein
MSGRTNLLRRFVLHTGNLGRVYRELGELDKALKCQEELLRKATVAGYREDQAYAHHHIGLTLLDKGDLKGGIRHLEEALTLSREPALDLKSLEAFTLNNLGTVYLRMDRPAKAMDYLRPALDLQDESSDPRMLTLVLVNLGTALVAGNRESALAAEMLDKALGIAEDLGDVRTQIAARQKLAEALGQCGRYDDALAAAKAQRAEAKLTGDLDMEVNAIRTIGDLHLAVADVASARDS